MRVILADDHSLVRQGIKQLLSQDKRFTHFFETNTMSSVLTLLMEHSPIDLLILDYKMPDGDAFSTISRLHLQFPKLPIIVVTGSQSGVTMRSLASSHIHALLLKEGSPEEILTAVDVVLKGERYISPTVHNYLEQTDVNLTARELQVLNMIVLGLTRSQIAEHLCISGETVKSHRKNLMDKINAHTVTELILKSQELSLLEDT